LVWLEGKIKPEILQPVPVDKSEDVSWIPPATVFAWGQGIPLEPVRFAGMNLLCIEIDYRKLNGELTQRMVEPYSLRRTLAGHIILHAHDRTRRALRSFRVDSHVSAKHQKIHMFECVIYL
jgi:hypothetical protein